MRPFRWLSYSGIVFVFIYSLSVSAQETDAVLSLAAVEQLALSSAPVLARAQANVDAADQASDYAGRLPDPQLSAGVVNLPADSYRFDEEAMTMGMLGVRQAFPPGNTLSLRSQRAQHNFSREQARLESVRRELLRQVRVLWLELYFQDASLKILKRSRALQENQLRAAENRYRAAVETPQAVLQAREQLVRLDAHEQVLLAQAQGTRAQLARWIGPHAYQAMTLDFPVLPPVSGQFSSHAHPELHIAQAELDAAHSDAAIAQQAYKPGFMLELSYGFRQEQANMLTAMVTLDLPLFPNKRQDRRLAESRAMETAARFNAEDKSRALLALYQAVRAQYDSLTAQVKLYQERLLPDVRREARITITGFARDQAQYRVALQKELDTELELTRLQTELAKTQAELLYLTGEPTT